jgi:hypothetical protein
VCLHLTGAFVACLLSGDEWTGAGGPLPLELHGALKGRGRLVDLGRKPSACMHFVGCMMLLYSWGVLSYHSNEHLSEPGAVQQQATQPCLLLHAAINAHHLTSV